MSTPREEAVAQNILQAHAIAAGRAPVSASGQNTAEDSQPNVPDEQQARAQAAHDRLYGRDRLNGRKVERSTDSPGSQREAVATILAAFVAAGGRVKDNSGGDHA